VAEHQALKIAIDEEETLTVAKVVFGDLRSIGQNECINHFGNLCNVDRFLAIGSRHDFAFFKDAADSIGSKFYGKLAGNMGYFNGFSFHGTKAMTTGEGGVFFTFTYDRQRGLSRLLWRRSPIVDFEYMQLFSIKPICYLFGNVGHSDFSRNLSTNLHTVRHWLSLCPILDSFKKTFLTLPGIAQCKRSLNVANSFSAGFKLDAGDRFGLE